LVSGTTGFALRKYCKTMRPRLLTCGQREAAGACAPARQPAFAR
jgi:hypothetical protein